MYRLVSHFLLIFVVGRSSLDLVYKCVLRKDWNLKYSFSFIHQVCVLHRKGKVCVGKK